MCYGLWFYRWKLGEARQHFLSLPFPLSVIPVVKENLLNMVIVKIQDDLVKKPKRSTWILNDGGFLLILENRHLTPMIKKFKGMQIKLYLPRSTSSKSIHVRFSTLTEQLYFLARNRKFIDNSSYTGPTSKRKSEVTKITPENVTEN